VVDEVRVFRLLRAITDALDVLRQEASAGEERRADPMWLRGVKYTFVTSIEVCVDIAQHIYWRRAGVRRRTTATR
jgi:uncharacterized protein YutE (UPF0331/DUF86 family)